MKLMDVKAEKRTIVTDPVYGTIKDRDIWCVSMRFGEEERPMEQKRFCICFQADGSTQEEVAAGLEDAARKLRESPK